MSDGFADQKAFAERCDPEIRRLLRELYPNAVDVCRADHADDLRGCDYWVLFADGSRLAVDAKAKANEPPSDLFLETWSDVDRRKVGWTLDPQKVTAVVFFYWADTGRGFAVPFRSLRAAFAEHKDAWCARHGTKDLPSRGAAGSWTGAGVAVPLCDIVSALAKHVRALRHGA